MWGERLGGRTAGHGFKSGVAAWLGGLVLVFAFMLAATGGGGAASVERPVADPALGYTLLHGWPVLVGTHVGALALGLVPVALLVAAGYTAATRTTDSDAGPVARGASVAAGYCPLAVLSLCYVLVRAGSRVPTDAGPSPTVAGSAGSAASIGVSGVPAVVGIVLVIGVAFPVVFGALGGLVASRRGY